RDGLRGHDLCERRIPGFPRYLHVPKERLRRGAHDLTAGGFLLRVDTALLTNVLKNIDVFAGLFEIFLPLVLELLVLRAFEGGLVNLHATALRFQRFAKKTLQLLLIHTAS